MKDTTIWQAYRSEVYESLTRGADALFNLADALLAESQGKSLAQLSLSPFFERKWPSVYEALEDGRINVKRLREAGVKALLADKGALEPVCIAVDTSAIERTDAQTSQDRGIIHVSNLPLADKPIGVGWTFSTVVLLPDEPSSWAPILDQERVPTSQTPIQVAIGQLKALRPLLGGRPVTVLADRAYATPGFLRACLELGYRVIVRIKSNRKLYRPGGVRIHTKGPTPKDGALFQGKDKQTHGQPEAVCQQQDHKGRPIRISRFGGLHFKEDRQLCVKIIGVECESAKNTKRDPHLSWFVTLDEDLPLHQIPIQYALRFCVEHVYRFLKQDLLWTAAHVRTPEQFERWSWIVAIAFNQLYLVRDLGQGTYHPWERKDRPLTPRQVRRVMPTLLSLLGTPARPCQPRGIAPGRPQGFHPKPAKRFPIIVKNSKKKKKPALPPQSSA
jgi:DDE superfamily endonuclease